MAPTGTLARVWQVYKESGCEASVHRTVQAKLGSDPDAPAVRAFLEELEGFLAEQELLLLMLSIGLGGLYETQASFIGILLREEVLQPKMVDLLLEKLSEFSAELDAQLMEKNIPKLILRELRWMDLVVDSQQLLEKLLGALPAFSPSLQRDVIYILPEIASDEDGLIVVDALLDLIRSDAGLVVCCIEALGNFNVLNEQTASVVQCVLERLDSSPLTDLAAIVKYLVQEAPATNMDDIVDQLRDKLSATLAFEDASSAHSSSGGNEEALILGSIVQGFYFREELLKMFVTKIQATGPGVSPLRLLDVWVLIGAHSIPKHQDKMAKLLKKKVHTRVLSVELMIRCVQSHANALKAYFSSLLQLGSMLLSQTSDDACLSMGSVLYELLFEEFSTCSGDEASNNQTVFYQGEIVSALLGHCLSRATLSKHAAFGTFIALVSPKISFHDNCRNGRGAYAQSPSQRRERLRMFLPALKQMLDTMENCSADEVRKIYDILFAIGGYEDPDLCNTLRKQAYHQDTRYRCFGIIAAVSRIKRLLTFIRESAEAASKSSSNDDPRASRLSQSSAVTRLSDVQVGKLFSRSLMELHESCMTYPKCLSFMLRELDLFVASVDVDQYGGMLVEVFSDYYSEVLLNRFMDDFDVKKKHDGTYTKVVLDGAVKTDLWVGLDDKLSPVYLKIFDLVVSPHLADQQSLLYLSSLIALLLSCARTKKQLTEIECVLVCPVQMMERSALEELSGLDPNVQNAICSTLWHAINWIRSILNFFACETKDYYVAKVAERLDNLSLLESILLDDILSSCPSFTPPGSSKVSAVNPPSHSVVKASGGKKKPGRLPAKKISNMEERKLLVKQSFIPLRPEVVNILISPRLQPADVAMQASSSRDAQVNGALPMETPLIQFLFSLLEHHVQRCCSDEKKKKASVGFWARVSGQTANGDDLLLEHQQETQTVDKLLDAYHGSGVLQAVGRFAAHVLAATEHDQVQLGADAGIDRLEVDTRVVQHKGILTEYLKVVTAAIRHGIESEDADAPSISKVQQLQALILPSEECVDYTEQDPDLLQQIVKKCFKVISRCHRVVGDNLDFAVALLKCLTSVLSFGYGFDADQVLSKVSSIDLNGAQQRRASLTSAIAAKISGLALSYLQKDWSNGDAKFVYKNAHLEVFLNGYLHHSAVVLDSIQTLALDGFLELLEHNGKRVEAYPTLDKKTVGVYHRVMFTTLVAVTSRLDLAANDVKFTFNYLTQGVLLFKLLVCMTKSFQKSMIVASVLKIGRKFIEMILRAMPFLQEQFLVHNERVIKLISELQVATRRMQVLCAHGKLVKDQSAASQVPMVKKLLERLIYRGEELASANGVLDAYTTGVLKNRRIDGTTISKEELEAASDDDSENDSETEEEVGHEEEEEQEEEEDAEEKTELPAVALQDEEDSLRKNADGQETHIVLFFVVLGDYSSRYHSERCADNNIKRLGHERAWRALQQYANNSKHGTLRDRETQDVKLTIGATGVSATPATELETEAVLFEAQYEALKEIVWDHSEKSLTFVLLDGGRVAASFLFSTLSQPHLKTLLYAATQLEEQLGQTTRNPALRRRPEHVYMGVLAGKTLPSTIQQRRPSTSSLSAANLKGVAESVVVVRRQI